jgi:hypothetical protein
MRLRRAFAATAKTACLQPEGQQQRMTPEDLEQIRGIAREETAAAEAGIVDRLTETMRDVETKLLTAFHGHASGQAAELRRLDF